ncbi:family 78 glycoside hydrolase catalytic domain [Blautia schinkii]|nr:family 78 glycoside hydrolase catalytic domain [Blautia schinkii]
MFEFQKACPVWGEELSYEYNQHLGFRTDVTVPQETDIRIHIAARSYYRLYVNGEMKSHGPARAAKGHCRVDEIMLRAAGVIKIAIEVIAYDKDVKYCNDNTMEPGLLACEVCTADEGGNWKTAAATGTDDFRYTELLYRSPMTELMSHCRGIMEHYCLTPEWAQWRTDDYKLWKCPVSLNETVRFQKRGTPYADYHPIPVSTLQRVKRLVPDKAHRKDSLHELAKMINPSWYEKLDEEERFVDLLLAEKEETFSGRWNRQYDKINVLNCEGNAAFVFCIPASELGFVHIRLETERAAVVDIINSDYKSGEGTVDGNTYAVRYELAPGSYDLTTFEPMLVKYIKLVFRTDGGVTFHTPELLDYAYPDEKLCTFECSDGELNLIYEGARRTLRLNTLDIFMDCPQRERGGWLCDAQFTAPAAWQMFGDLCVEKDFIENFMCTDFDDYKDAFFPEVYPGVSRVDKSPGIESWSFWLLTQFWDYYQRSGDREFINRCYSRIKAFLDAVAAHVGESGLFENFDILFVDWSLSNSDFCLKPISIPVNCLIVRAYECMAELYGTERWSTLAARVRKRIDEVRMLTGADSDGYRYENGRFLSNGCRTESGLALELWCGFHRNDRERIRTFTESMGTAPVKRPDPNIGRSNLFIGLMIRFEVLAKAGRIDTLVRELKDVYLPQLLKGPGTLYEGIHDPSGCHGFNANAGALIVNHVLGLGQPMQLTKTVRIAPHPGVLDWAEASAKCSDGMIFFDWKADHEAHVLEMELVLPEGWRPVVELPFELAGWCVHLNGEVIQG